MPVVNLPPGCAGFTMEDGTRYSGREGGSVTVSDAHGAAIRRQTGGDAGLTGFGSFRTFLGTRDGRWCQGCRKLWQRWSLECPRCGAATVPEADRPAAPPSMMPSGCCVPIAPQRP